MSAEIPTLFDKLQALEKEEIYKAWFSSGRNQTHAAKMLGISRRAMIYKLEKFGLKLKPGVSP